MKKFITSVILLLICTENGIAQNYEANSEANTVTKIVPSDATISDVKPCDFRYYYYPNLQAYYDVENKNYIYKENGIWNKTLELPQYYGGYSMFKNAKVKITDYIGDNPQQYVNTHKKAFPYVAKGRFPYKTEASDN